MIAVLIVAGIAGEIIVRWLVGSRRLGVWAGEGTYFTVLGVLALLVAPISWWNAETGPWLAAAAGLGAALLLFAATRVFLTITRGWGAFSRQTVTLYGARADVSIVVAVVVSILAAMGEELFWRGTVQASWGAALTPLAGAVVAWVANVIVTTPNRSLPITIGTAVGALAWGLLVLMTGGVLASIVCHVAWTVAMLLVPPRSVASEAVAA